MMDFFAAFTAVEAHLTAHGYRAAVVGGIAMAAYGIARTTLDLDIVVMGEAQETLISFLEREGYETLHRSSGYSNHLHTDPERGRIDVVYVRGQTTDSLFERVRRVETSDGRSLPVVCPEHLAALKIFAMKNDPSRRFRELEDIRSLLTLPTVNRDMIREQFERHGMAADFDELERSL